MNKILIVDDDNQTILQLESLIRDYGHTPLSTLFPTSVFESMTSKLTV